jgi:Domain of unknown function (DUF1932)
VIVGLVHPGEMGAAIGAAVQGHEVVWASEGRSDATRARAAGFRDVGSLAALLAEADVLLSVCPPHAALEVARAALGFDGIYVDANAISPEHVQQIAALHSRFVDGGIIGGPPRPRVYLTGEDAAVVARLLNLDTRIVPNASALKMTYAAWSKGTAALLLAIRDVAAAYGTLDELEAEWRQSVPELLERLPQAERAAAAKGWRWIGEMEEIADTFAAAGQPEGFHRAAAEVYRG